MLQRFGISFILMFTIIIIFAFCITEDKAGVVLRNFKSRRMIMEELEEEEKALKARLSLNLATDAPNETTKSEILMNESSINGTDKITNSNDLAVGLKNISHVQSPKKSHVKKNSKATPKKKIPNFKNQKSVVNSQIANASSSRKPNILTNSFVEYLENRGKRMEDEMLSSEKLTNSFVEYLESRGKRMEDEILPSENDKEVVEAFISTNETNESSPFRLISQVNESLFPANEISENSSLPETVNLDGNKEMLEAELEKTFTVLQELDNQTLKNSDLDDSRNIEDVLQFNMKNFTETVKEIFETNITELPVSSFSESSPISQEKENDSKVLEEIDFENLVSANHVNNSELKITSNDFISGVNEEQFKNITISNTIEDSKKSLDDEGMSNQVEEKETKHNESSIKQIVSEIEEDMIVKPFEPQESSDIIQEAAKEIAEIIPASNETVALENIEEFVLNLTDVVHNMSDEDIIHLEPDDEHINQSIHNEDPTLDTIGKENVERDDEHINQSIHNEDPVLDTIGKENDSATILKHTHDEFELSLESVVSSGLDFIVNSEVAKNAATAMEVFNMSDSSLTDHVIEDSDMHSLIDIMMPSALINEIEPISKDPELIGSNETIASNSSMEVIEIKQKKSTLDINSTSNASLVDDNTITESAIVLDAKPNASSPSTERKCPDAGICIFWFMSRDSCSDHSQCLGEKMCCRVRCSKSCIDI